MSSILPKKGVIHNKNKNTTVKKFCCDLVSELLFHPSCDIPTDHNKMLL